MKDHTVYIDCANLDLRNIIRTNSILIVAVYKNELPLNATLVYAGRNYNIKEHTKVIEKQTNYPLYVYIAEDRFG